MKHLHVQDARGLLSNAFERRALAFGVVSRLISRPDANSMNETQQLARGLRDGDATERALFELVQRADLPTAEHAWHSLLALAEGFGSAAELSEHLAVEFNVYGELLSRQSALLDRGTEGSLSEVREARRAFLEGHLAKLIVAFVERGDEHADALLAPVLHAAAALVSDECARLDVTLQ